VAALEATLYAYEAGDALETIPTLRMLTETRVSIRRRARALFRRLSPETHGATRRGARDATSQVGGGALPTMELPTAAVALGTPWTAAQALDERLRLGHPPVLGRLLDDRLLLDFRTILPRICLRSRPLSARYRPWYCQARNGGARPHRARRREPGESAGAIVEAPARSVMKHVVVGTAGHIDHGKTSLVKALTGTDTDRLPEEKARGIHDRPRLRLSRRGGGSTIEIVDVPGHERFVKNMLAAVGGIDLALLVIAADEGVMPQTREIWPSVSCCASKSGMVALTKTDLVEPGLGRAGQGRRRAAPRRYLPRGCPIAPVSVKTGQGLPELRQTLARLAAEVLGRGIDQTARLPIDRVFTIKGFGTVVTGTLMAGRLAVDDKVEIFPRGLQAKVRGLQVHGRAVESAQAGQRTAVNLQGVERAAIERGRRPRAGGRPHPDPPRRRHPRAPRRGSAAAQGADRVRFHVGTQEVDGSRASRGQAGGHARRRDLRPLPSRGARQRAAR